MEAQLFESMKQQLMTSDDSFRELALQHATYKKQVEELEALPHPTDEQILEEARLKKLKLHLKDQMVEYIERHQLSQVS